jgi:hypothetical protein
MTTTTFADYAATAEERKDIQLNVTKWTLMLCDALKQNYIDYNIKNSQKFLKEVFDDHWKNYYQEAIEKLKNGECDYDFTFETGRKYHKIIMVIDNGPNCSPSRSVHAFVDKKTGQIYKSSSWKSPAKGVRYDLRIIEQREWLLQNADWASNYLYAR